MNNQEQEKLESIWADGIPQNITDDKKLEFKDLLLMAVDHIVKNYAVVNGFKIEQVNAKPEVLPHIIMKKNDKIYTVIVLPFLYPNYGSLNEEVRISFVKKMNELEAVALFAPVGFASTDKERAKASLALKGDTFNLLFRGFVVLTDEPNQKLLVPNDQYVTQFN